MKSLKIVKVILKIITLFFVIYKNESFKASKIQKLNTC